MKESNPIHIKLEYDESLQSRRDILSSEMNLIEVIKSVKKFQLLRKEELTYKLRLQKQIKKLSSDIKKLQDMLPKPKIPEILKKPEEFKARKRLEQPSTDDSLEKELRDIQARLNSLAG